MRSRDFLSSGAEASIAAIVMPSGAEASIAAIVMPSAVEASRSFATLRMTGLLVMRSRDFLSSGAEASSAAIVMLSEVEASRSFATLRMTGPLAMRSRDFLNSSRKLIYVEKVWNLALFRFRIDGYIDKLLPFVIALWSVLLALVLAVPVSAAPLGQAISNTLTSQSNILQGQAIWASEVAPSGSVILFRRDFSLYSDAEMVELSIIADTRYEVWLDGEWLGRGPARFSKVRQEFDTYSLGKLPPGSHTLAVLVHYAPNTRRSQDLGGGLVVDLSGRVLGVPQSLVTSDDNWRALVSPAWDAAVESISALNLIGPMEVLDLGLLPDDWMVPGFDDTSWPFAQTLTPSPFTALTPRSIPMLVDELHLPVAVTEQGLLSPDCHLMELTGDDSEHLLVFGALTTTVVSVEALETGNVTLDGQSPQWRLLEEEHRPDVVVTSWPVNPGPHELRVEVSAQGRTLAVCGTSALTMADWPEVVAVHNPGNRMLLSNPVPGWNAGILPADMESWTWQSEMSEVEGNAGILPANNWSAGILPADMESWTWQSKTSEVEGSAGILPADWTWQSKTSEVEAAQNGINVAFPAGAHYLVLDFGRTLHARVVMTVAAPASTIIDAGWDERLTAGRPFPVPGSLLPDDKWQQVDSWTLDGTTRRLTTLDTRAGRYLLLQVFSSGPVHITGLHALEEVYPVEQRGYFTSSDPLLNRIWQVGLDTLRPNMTDAYTDTPWRERGQWWGDAWVAFHINRVAYGDMELFVRGIRQIADAAQVKGHPVANAPHSGDGLMDYGLLWVESVYTAWQLTGNVDIVAEYYSDLQNVVDYLRAYENAAGLLDFPFAEWPHYIVLIDWGADAKSSRYGESTALNALYASVLRHMGEMSVAVSYASQAQAYYTQADSIQTAINQTLYVDTLGGYAASRYQGELLPPTAYAQAYALQYGLVPSELQSRVANTLLDQLNPFFYPDGWSRVEPYGMFWVLGALGESRHVSPALSLIRQQYGRLLDLGATTWWEIFSPNQWRWQSLSHAWGGSPTWFLSNYVLGAQVMDSEHWQIAPQPGGLQWAQGTVPFSSDELEVSWQYPNCGEFYLSLTAPEDTLGDVILPTNRYDVIVTLDDVVIWSAGSTVNMGQKVRMSDKGLVVQQIEGGHHSLSLSFSCHAAYLPAVVGQGPGQ